MGNRADDAGSDVEIYRKVLTDTVHADSRSDAPEKLLALLDHLGLERKAVYVRGVPLYVWHEAPEHLDEHEKKRLVTRAFPTLLRAGYIVHIADYLFDEAAYRQAVRETRAEHTAPGSPAAATPAPADPAPRTGRRRSA